MFTGSTRCSTGACSQKLDKRGAKRQGFYLAQNEIKGLNFKRYYYAMHKTG